MNMKRMIRVSMPTLLACFTLVWMVSCLDNDDTNPQPTPVAFVSIYNASPDAPPLDIVVDGQQINAGPFDFAEYSGYQRFFTGARNFQFSPFDANNVVIDSTVTFEDQKVYSVFVVDEFEKTELLVLNDSSPAPAAGKAKIRFINLSPDGDEAAIREDGQADNIIGGLLFKQASDFIEVDAKSYDFQITAGGAGDIILQVPDTNLQSGVYYTVVLKGYETPPGGNTHVLSAQVLVNN